MTANNRSYEKELLDLGPAHYTPEEYEECLHQLGQIGKYFGDSSTLKVFRKLKSPASILDVGSGGGQFAIRLARQYPDAQVVGVDLAPEAIAFANKQRRLHVQDNVRFELAATPQLSYPSGSFDVVTATLVCHHLDDDELVDFLQRATRIAKHAVVINDLHRHPLTSLTFAAISNVWFRNRLIRHDGLLSIKRGFKKQDWKKYLMAAGIPLEWCSITWHWAFRWVVCIDTSLRQKG